MMWFGLGSLLLLLALGAPLFAILGGMAALLFTSSDGTLPSLSFPVYSQQFADSPNLFMIPFFTVAGYLLAESGAPRRLVRLSSAMFGWMPGGLAIVCLLASSFFTTFSGGSGITIVAIGGILFPALVSQRYPERFSLGLVTTGGSLGLLFPPAVPMLLYALVAGLLLDRVYLAGFIPGMLSVLALVVYAVVMGKREKIPRTPFEPAAAWSALREGIWELLLPVVLLGGFASGLLRIHECAVFAAFYVLMIEVFVYRDLSLRDDVPRVVRDSMSLVGAILVIMATSLGFTGYLVQADVPGHVVHALTKVVSGPLQFLLLLNVFLLLVGMLMDVFSAILVVVPLIVPVATHFEIDPYHLAVIFVLNLEIGYLTPPVGLNLFISSFRFRQPVSVLYRSVLPYVVVLAVALVATTYVPQLSTWLPEMMADGEPMPESPIQLEEVEEGLTLDDL